MLEPDYLRDTRTLFIDKRYDITYDITVTKDIPIPILYEDVNKQLIVCVITFTKE